MKATLMSFVVLAISALSAQGRDVVLVYLNGTTTRCTVLKTSDDSVYVRFGSSALTRWVRRASVSRVVDGLGKDITAELFQPHVLVEEAYIPTYRTEVVLNNNVVLHCNIIDSTGSVWLLAMERGERRVARSAITGVRDLAARRVLSLPSTAIDARGAPIGPVRKDPALAGILSFLVVGLGQVYNEQPVKGFVLMTATAGCYYGYLSSIEASINSAGHSEVNSQPAWLFFALGFHLYSIVDAVSVAPRVGMEPGLNLTLRVPVREP